MDEGLIHVAVRKYLKERHWQLVAGQFPGGSDDECKTLSIVDPTVACDNSPDPRRHSDNKLVPDLFAMRWPVVLIVEMKPSYSQDDEAKLSSLLAERRPDLIAAMMKFGRERGVPEFLEPDRLILVPALGFQSGNAHPVNATFAYFKVAEINSVRLDPPTRMSPEARVAFEVQKS